MSKRAVLEVIALDVEDAVAAQAGGADRLELVTEMAADGLTPAPATVAAIRAAVDIDLRVMLRLADGFAAGDVDRLVGVAGELRQAGADQFVLGLSARTAVWTWPRWSGWPARSTAAGGPSTGRSTGPPTGTPCASSSPTCPASTPTSRPGPPRAWTTACPRCSPRRPTAVSRGTSSRFWSAADCAWTMCRGCGPAASRRSTSAARPAPTAGRAPSRRDAVARWRTMLDGAAG